MEYVRKKFFLLEIKNQVRYGILAVSFCVGLLVFFLILTYSFVMANMSYVDVIGVIDQMETESIQKINDYYINYQMINEEMSKVSIQWIRNLLNNLEKTNNLSKIKLFEENFDKFFINVDERESKSEYCKNSLYKCLYYKYNGFMIKDELQGYSNNYFRRLYHTLPMLKIISNIKLIGYESDKDFFKNFIIQSYDLQTTLYYSKSGDLDDIIYHNYSEIGYNLFESYEKLLNNLSSNFPDELKDTLYEINQDHLKNYNLPQISNKHPNIMKLDYPDIKATISFSLEESFLRMVYNRLSDYIAGIWNEDIENKMRFDILKEFRGINAIFTKERIQEIREDNEDFGNISNDGNSSLELLDSFGVCEYFRRLHNKHESLLKNITPLNQSSTLLDCFYEEKTRKELENLINLNKWLKNSYKRKVKIPLFNSDKKIKKQTNYKILKSQYPDEKSLQIYVSEFLFFNRYNIYFFCVSKYSENIFDSIFLRFLGMMMLIILSIVALWIFIIFIIYLLIISVTFKLTNPIKTFVSTLSKIAKLDDKDLLMEIEKIEYKDDSRINKLFKICKEMINGGFNVKSEKIKSEVYEDSNQMSLIKFNNILIREEKIENEFNKDVNNIFNFVPSNLVLNEIEEINENTLSKDSLDDESNFLINDDEINGGECGINVSCDENGAIDQHLLNDNSNSFSQSDDLNLSLINDELLSKIQRNEIDQIMGKGEFLAKESGNKKSEGNKEMDKELLTPNKPNAFMCMENLFDFHSDKYELNRVSDFTLKKGVQNVLFMYYKNLNYN